MINGKFFTGLPANMLDRSKGQGLNRQQTNFFWPDDSQNVSAVDSRIKRRTSFQAESRDAYVPMGRADQSNSDVENKERFKKEFTRSSIQFYDNVEQTPLRRNQRKLTAPPQQKPQNVEPPVNLLARRKEALTSKIEFFDYAEDLNNVPKTDKNNKVDMEKNTKNSPKLQNKNLSFDPPTDETIHFIENDVRNMRIAPSPPRRRNTVRDSRPVRYGRMPMNTEPHYSDYSEDYLPARSRPMPPPPTRNRYPESDPDFDEYIPRRSAMAVSPRPVYYPPEPLDYTDGHPSSRQYYEEAMPTRKLGRQVQYKYSSNEQSNYDAMEQPPPPQQRPLRKSNILKVDNDFRNNEQMMPRPSPTTTSPPPPSQQHLRSNICFSDTESAAPAPCPPQPKRNIRSSAVNRVSVGLPD